VYRPHSRPNSNIFTLFPVGVKTLRMVWRLTTYGVENLIRFGLKSLRKHTKTHQKTAEVLENQRRRRHFQEHIYRQYTGNRKAVTNQKCQHKPPITNHASNQCANAHLVVVATSCNEFNLADWRDTCSLDAPTPHKCLTTFRPFLAMFTRTVRKIINYGNAKFPENEAIDYLKHFTSSSLSFPPFVFFHPPSLFHFSLPSHIFSIVLADYETSCVYRFQNPLSSVYLIVLLLSALRFVSSYSLNTFSPVQDTQSFPVRSATRLPTLKLPHLSVSFHSEKFKLIKFYCLFQGHQSNMFMYRHTSSFG